MWFCPPHNNQTCVWVDVALRSTLLVILLLLVFFRFFLFLFFRSSLIIGSCTCVLWLTYLLSFSESRAITSDKVEMKWLLLICVDKTEIFFNTSFLVEFSLVPSLPLLLLLLAADGWFCCAIVEALDLHDFSTDRHKIATCHTGFLPRSMLTINDYIVAFLSIWPC